MSIDNMTERPTTVTYGEANAAGREAADQLIVRMKMTGNPTLLGAAMKDLIGRGTYGPEEIGFSQRLADQIIAAD